MNGMHTNAKVGNAQYKGTTGLLASMRQAMKYCGDQIRTRDARMEPFPLSEPCPPDADTDSDKTGCIAARTLSLGYGKKIVLEDIDLKICKGEFVSIIGPSGVGKSTLLMALNGNVGILGGDLTVLNHNLSKIDTATLKKVRSRIGAIYQGFNLVKRLSVLDNIASGMLSGMGPFCAAVKYYTHDQYEQIFDYMQAVGIEREALQRCDRLSGGQMQRVAIARALAQKPEIILADEPISSLDPVSARNVMDILAQINLQYGITIIANLHQLDYATNYCTRLIGINGGKIVYDGKPDIISKAAIHKIYQDEKYERRRLLAEMDVGSEGPSHVYHA
jgi:phosphonate transport system ATP-binding protein